VIARRRDTLVRRCDEASGVSSNFARLRRNRCAVIARAWQAGIKEIVSVTRKPACGDARQQAVLEKRFAEKQITIKWIEFTSGPPLLKP